MSAGRWRRDAWVERCVWRRGSDRSAIFATGGGVKQNPGEKVLLCEQPLESACRDDV